MTRRASVLKPALKVLCASAFAVLAFAAPAHAVPAFDPSIDVGVTNPIENSPTGFDFTLIIPQDGLTDPDGIAPADLKKAVVRLPPGMTLSPSAAQNLGSCRSDQIHLRGGGRPECPTNSVLGSVVVSTPLLDHELGGKLYLARPYDNPFKALVAIYLVIDDPQTGILIKLPGEVDLKLRTGEIVTTFDDNPQLPFERLDVHLDKPSPGGLITPACGTYPIQAELWNWARPNELSLRTDSVNIAPAAGGPCVAGAPAPAAAPSLFASPLSARNVFSKAKKKRKARKAQRRHRNR